MSAPALILVRHARPEIAPDVPPPRWRLSAQGRADAEALAELLTPFEPAAAVASTEPKAIETAVAIAGRLGLTVVSDPAFDEHHRTAWPFEADPARAQARVERTLAAPTLSVEGAETGTAALARFRAGLASHAARPLVVVSHGCVLSLYLAAALGLEAVGVWNSLRLPEAFLLDADGGLLDRIAPAA